MPSLTSIMSFIEAEPVDPYIFEAIATGRPKLEISVDGETVVKTDPDSVYYNGPFVKDVASVKEEPLANDDPVCFFRIPHLMFVCIYFSCRTQKVPTTSRRKRRRENDAEFEGASGEVSSADLCNV